MGLLPFLSLDGPLTGENKGEGDPRPSESEQLRGPGRPAPVVPAKSGTHPRLGTCLTHEASGHPPTSFPRRETLANSVIPAKAGIQGWGTSHENNASHAVDGPSWEAIQGSPQAGTQSPAKCAPMTHEASGRPTHPNQLQDLAGPIVPRSPPQPAQTVCRVLNYA